MTWERSLAQIQPTAPLSVCIPGMLPGARRYIGLSSYSLSPMYCSYKILESEADYNGENSNRH